MINIIKGKTTIGVIGLSKNSGKTTTLNHIILTCGIENLGLTSIGLDGETLDQVNFLPKPKIKVQKGMIVATTTSCLELAHLKYELLKSTQFFTAIGEIHIVRILECGYMMIAGPSLNKELNQVIRLMKQYTSFILVDGAFNRMTFANIAELDTIILASGAAYHHEMDETIKQTTFVVNLFSSKETNHMFEDSHYTLVIETNQKLYRFLDKKENTVEQFFKQKEGSIKWIFIKGALSERLMNQLMKHDIRDLTLILEDPTKMLLKHTYSTYFQKRNISIEVLKPTPISMVTINPWSPSGHHYDEQLFYDTMKRHIFIPVFNVYQLEDKHV